MQNFLDQASRLSRRKKIVVQLSSDALMIVVALLGAMILRLDSFYLAAQPGTFVTLFFTIAITLSIFWWLGLYRVITRSLTGKILVLVGKGSIAAGAVLSLTAFLLGSSIPWSVSIIFSVLVFLFTGGIRFLIRSCFRSPSQSQKKPVIIYGAGEVGLQLLNALFHGNKFIPVALVDDNTSLHGMSIGGLKVYSPKELPYLLQNTSARMVLLALPGADKTRRGEIVAELKELHFEVKTVPSMSDIITGKSQISELRKISIEDLLGRDPVIADPDLLKKNITGRVVMVTGAGGSIGSELCRQVLSQDPTVLVLYELSELALYTIEAELSNTAAKLQKRAKIVPILGSVQQSQTLEAAIETFNVQTIYHAAAYKHVPMVEENIAEGILNNVFGTLAITQAAKKHGVENFILVSTDKAVRPTNVMGATKRIAELICQAHALETASTIFTMVRFGNVLGSSGSVIPRFREQIEAGGPLTVTHKDITRYFMTIPEAAQLVVQAGALGKGGDVFVLDMGHPVKILDLAFSMVKLHDLTPYVVDHLNQIQPEKGDIPIAITGLRKGEKLYEELLIGNNSDTSKHPQIITASELSVPSDILLEVLDRLMQACTTRDIPRIIAILHELPLGYAPLSTNISDLLWASRQDFEAKRSLSRKVNTSS